MQRFIASTFATLLAAHAAQAQLDPAGAARLEALRLAPETAGAPIYRGDVFAQGERNGAPLFHYERRVAVTAGGERAAHVTRDASGELLIVEQAEFTPTYALQRFEAVNRQLGISASAVVSEDGRRIDYRLVRNGELTTASERLAAPAVSGPSLHGFVLQHWDALARGHTLPVRMIVLAEKTSYGFDIRRLREADGVTAFSVTPSHWLLRLAIAPLTIAFDSHSRHIVRYEGRVPPMRMAGGKLHTLNARVDYTMSAASYR